MTDQVQLPLDVKLKSHPDLAQFIESEPRVIAPMLEALVAGTQTSWVYLNGPHGSGKTHCSLAVNQFAQSKGLNSHYLSASSLEGFAASVLDQIDGVELLILDDIDKLIGDRNWEEALFHLLNRSRSNESRILCTGHKNIRRMPFSLPDLQSRMAAFVSQTLAPLDDEGKILALQLRAESRGFRLETEVADYLLRRVSRNLPDLIELLDRIDTVLLVTKRRLTIPLVREHLLPNR